MRELDRERFKTMCEEYGGVFYNGTIGTYNEKSGQIVLYDDTFIVSDEKAIKTSRDLARKEGIMCGISSGTNVAAALELAKILGKGKTVVTVLPDTAERYFSTPLFDEEICF